MSLSHTLLLSRATRLPSCSSHSGPRPRRRAHCRARAACFLVIPALIACKADEPTKQDSGPTDTAETTQPDPFAVVDPRDVVSSDTEEALQRVLDALVTDQGVMGAQVAVWLEGELVVLQTTGVRRSGDSTPVDRDTLFQLGSTTKMLTATAVLQQVDAGRLALDTTIDTALGGFELARSPAWTSTLHGLLTHQGDLYDLWDMRSAPDDAALADGLAEFETNGWAFAPSGTTFNYSNTHYSLLGRAVEVATGDAWADVLERDVAAPLGMSRTFARTSEAIADGNYCLGDSWLFPPDMDPWNPLETWDYALRPGGDTAPEDAVDNAFTRPAALVWSTAVDELRFAAFLVDGNPDVLSEASRTALVTPWVEMRRSLPGLAYGYGLFIERGLDLNGWWQETPVWSHSGNTTTHASLLYMVPERRFALSIVSTGMFTDHVAVAAKAIHRLLSDSEEGTPPEWSVVETDPAALVGTYRDPALGPLVVSLNGDELNLDIQALTDAGGYTIDPHLRYSGYTDIYLLAVTNELGRFDLEFTFVADEEGTYRWLVSRYIGGEREA